MLRIFAGYDPRESAGFHVFTQSLIETSSNYELTPQTGREGDGTNQFHLCRFGVPEACGWSGWALSLDGSDMLVRDDLSKILALRNSKYAVQVVKHDYKTKQRRKYLGTAMEADNQDYPMKNWSSVILWNCGHKAHFDARNELRGTDGSFLHRFAWLDDEQIGEIPVEWNWLADEYGENKEAKLLHWTCGMPGFYQYREAPHAHLWQQAMRNVVRGMD